MKTAMQELIEHIQINATKFSLMNTYNILKEIEPYLEKEKEQIQNVFEHCWNHPNWKGEYDIKDMQEYLKTNNQNK